MSFTILFAVFSLLVLTVIFGLTYRTKGLKTAFITTGAAFLISVLLFVAIIQAIVNAMPN